VARACVRPHLFGQGQRVILHARAASEVSQDDHPRALTLTGLVAARYATCICTAVSRKTVRGAVCGVTEANRAGRGVQAYQIASTLSSLSSFNVDQALLRDLSSRCIHCLGRGRASQRRIGWLCEVQ